MSDSLDQKRAAYLSRRVDDRDEILQVSGNKRIVQDPILVSQALQERVLGQVAAARL